jgi:hypothetical protein
MVQIMVLHQRHDNVAADSTASTTLRPPQPHTRTLLHPPSQYYRPKRTADGA